MTKLAYSIPISDSAWIRGEADTQSWQMTIGKWIVELEGGFLVVRGLTSPEVVLKVEAS